MPILALAVAYNLSWLLARRRGFTGVSVLTGWLAVAATWSAVRHGPSWVLAGGLAAAAAWLLRRHWLHYFERPGVHCRELGGRLRMAGVGYGAVLNLEAPGNRSPRRTRHTLWIAGLDGDALRVRQLQRLRRLLEGAARVRFEGLRNRAGRLVARVYADGRDVAVLLAAAERTPLRPRRRAPRRLLGRRGPRRATRPPTRS